MGKIRLRVFYFNFYPVSFLVKLCFLLAPFSFALGGQRSKIPLRKLMKAADLFFLLKKNIYKQMENFPSNFTGFAKFR